MDAWTPGREGKGFVASDGLHLWPVDASGHPHHIEYAQETGSELPSQAFAVDRSGGVSSTDYARGGDRNPEYENMVASLHPDLHPAMQDTEDEFDLPDWHISSNGYRDDWNIHEFSDWFFVTADWHIESQVHNIGWTPNSPGKALISPEGQVHSWNIDPSTGTPDHIDVAKDQGLLDDRPQEYWSEPFGAMDYMSDHMGSYYIEPNGYTYNAYGNERDPKLFEADPRLHDQPEPEESEEEFDLQPDTWHEPNLRSDQSDSADQPASAISKLTFDAQDLGALPPPGTTHPAPGVPPPGAPSGHLDDILAPKHDDPLDELHEYMQQTPQAPDAPESSSQTFSAVSSPERIHWSKRILRALKRRIGAEEDKPYDKFETTLELHQQALEDGASTAHHHQSAADPEWLQDYIKRNGPHMYHYAADQDTANAIQRDGLLPHDVTGNRQWNGELTPRANSVYVGDANLAALNASGWGESPNPLFKRRPIFQVDLRKLDPNKINADEDQFWHREQEEFDERAEENPAWQIPAYDRDQHGTHGAWADAVPLNHPEHVEESMDQDPDDMQVGTMAYQGGIPPEAMQLLTHPEYQLSQDPRFRQDMMPEDAQMDAMEQEADLYPEWYEDEEEEQPAGVFGKTTHQPPQSQSFSSWRIGAEDKPYDKFETSLDLHQMGLARYGPPESHYKESAADPEWLQDYINRYGPHMYHYAADQDAADAIRRDGLVPHDVTGNAQWNGELTPRANSVYLGDANLAAMNASKWGNHPDLSLNRKRPIFQVDLRKLDPNKMNADEDQLWHRDQDEFDERAEENPAWQIPAYNTEQHGTHGAWADAVGLNHPEHVKESMDQDPEDMGVGTLAYQGGIPPEAMQLLTHPEYQLQQDPKFRQENVLNQDAEMDAMEQEAELHPELYEDEDEEEQPAGVFGKTAHQLAWQPGNEGKGLLTPEGELHTWSDDEDDSLSHLDYMHAHGVKANELFSIDSDGTTDSDNPALPTIEPRFQKADPEDGMSIDEIYPGAHMGDPGEPNHNVLGPADNPEVPDWTPGIRTSMLDDEARDAYVQQSGDPYMYHTTDQANLGSIAKHGLLPWDDPLVPTSPYHGSVFQTRPGHVYLGQEDHVGRLYGQPNVRANLNNLDSTRIKGDEDHFYNTPQNTVQITDPQEAEYFRDMGQLEENEFSGTQKVRAADYFGVGPSPVDDPEVDDDPDLHDNLGEWAADHDLSDPDMVQHSLNEGTLTHEGRVPPEALELYHPEQGWIPATQWHQQGQTFSSISTILEKEDIWTLNDPNQRLGHQGEALSHNSLAKSQSPIRTSASSIRLSTESDEVCPHCGHSECGEQCNCEHCSEGYNALNDADPNAAAHEFSPGGAYGPGQIDYTPGEEVGSERVLNSANQQISHRNWDDGRPCNCGWGNPKEWPVRTAAIKEASKLDWLQGRPDLQTPEGQQWLDWAGKQAPKYDELLPWMTREWKKNRLFYDPKQAQVYMLDSSDRSAQYQSLYWDPDKQNTRYLPAWQTALEDPTSRGLVPATPLWDTTKQNGPNVQNHIGDWADWYHSKQRQGLDINSKHALGQGQPFTVDHMLDAVQQHKADKKAEEAAQQTYHTFPDGHTVQRITNSDQAQEEGERMHHCLASYGNAIDKGVTQAYSLRDPQGKPLVTTEIRPPGGPTDHVQYDYEHMIDPQDVNELAEDFPDREQEPGNGTLVQMQGAHDAVPEEEHQDMMHQWMNTLPGGGVDTSHYMIGTGNWVSTPQGGNTLNTREIRPPESDEEMEDPDYYDEDEEQPQEPVTNLAEYQDLMRGHLDSYEDRHGVSLYPDHYSILHDLHSMDSDPSTYGDPSPSTPEEQRSEAENLYENAWQDPGFPRTLNHPDWQNRSSPGIDRLRELYQQNAQMGTVYHQPGVDAHYIVNPSHPNGQVQHDAFLRNGFEPVGQAPWIGYPEVMASSHQGQPPGFVPYDQSEHPIQQPEQPMANVYNTPRGIWSIHPDAPQGAIGQDPEDEFIGQAPWTFSGTGVPGESSYHGNEVPPGLVPPQQSFSSIQDWVFA